MVFHQNYLKLTHNLSKKNVLPVKTFLVINPLPSLSTRLLFLSPWSSEILEPARVLSALPKILWYPYCYGWPHCPPTTPVFFPSIDCCWSSGATVSPSSDSILLSPPKSIHTLCTASVLKTAPCRVLSISMLMPSGVIPGHKCK